VTDDDTRADWWENDDPFHDLWPSQLTAEHIANYARVAGIVYPFDERWLKGATYEVGVSGNVYYWDDESRKHILDVAAQPGGEITLQRNSITFVETDVEFRLPHYIAARFNLHIKLVHRGLLLGTGPIVDPGFRGKLLIPLHNLTNSSYTIEADEKIVWVEFSKTLFGAHSTAAGYESRPADFRVFPPSKRWRSPAEYLQKANGGNPIVSSIGGFVGQVRSDLEATKGYVRRLQWGAALTLIFALLGLLWSSWSLSSQAVAVVQADDTLRQSVDDRLRNLEEAQAREAAVRESANQLNGTADVIRNSGASNTNSH
jgi:deoxycytidine triphosphate deaminase